MMATIKPLTPKALAVAFNDPTYPMPSRPRSDLALRGAYRDATLAIDVVAGRWAVDLRLGALSTIVVLGGDVRLDGLRDALASAYGRLDDTRRGRRTEESDHETE